MKVAILKLSALGDIIQTAIAVKQWKALNSDISVCWIVEKRFADFVHSLDFISEVIALDIQGLKNNFSFKFFFSELKKLKGVQFDEMYDLQGNFKSFCVSFFIKSKLKVGFSKNCIPEKIALLGLDNKIDVISKNWIVDQYYSLLSKGLSNYKGGNTFDCYKKNDSTIIFIAIGSRWNNKKLSTNMWIKIIRYIEKELNLVCMLPFSSYEEEKEVDHIIQNCRFAKKFPKSNLKELKNEFSSAKAVIGVDSALIHLAKLSGVPTFCFFGPSSGKVYCEKISEFFQSKCPENIFFEKRCPYLRTCSHANCLKSLNEPEQITELMMFLFHL